VHVVFEFLDALLDGGAPVVVTPERGGVFGTIGDPHAEGVAGHVDETAVNGALALALQLAHDVEAAGVAPAMQLEGEAGSSDDNRKQEGGEGVSGGDRVGRSVAERQITGGLAEKAGLAQQGDEAGEPREGRDRLGGCSQKQVVAAGKRCKINGTVLCGGRGMGCVHPPHPIAPTPERKTSFFNRGVRVHPESFTDEMSEPQSRPGSLDRVVAKRQNRVMHSSKRS